MSELQKIVQSLSSALQDTKNSIRQLNDCSLGLSQMIGLVRAAMKGTSQREYDDTIHQLTSAKEGIKSTIISLSVAMEKGNNWISSHTGGNAGAFSPLSINDIDQIEDTDNSAIPEESSNRNKESEERNPDTNKRDTTEYKSVAEYLSAHNYGLGDFSVYSQDPVWRQLMRKEFPSYSLPELTKEAALAQLTKYMNEHNYGKKDFPEYSQDPVWRELQEAAFPDYDLPPLVNTDKNHSNVSETCTSVIDSLKQSNVEYRQIEKHNGKRSEEDIVKSLCGGDLTKGSCVSLALAYAGNRAGYDVLDFRDGASREFFSSRDSIQKVVNLSGVKSTILMGDNDIDCAEQLLTGMTSGKEYCLITGQHASIVRKTANEIEYLELQHPTKSGWHKIETDVLTNRFVCKESRPYKISNFLIDVESLSNSNEFLDILGYINTAGPDQKKGGVGNVR